MPTAPDLISSHDTANGLVLRQDPVTDDLGVVVRPIIDAGTAGDIADIVTNTANTATNTGLIAGWDKNIAPTTNNTLRVASISGNPATGASVDFGAGDPTVNTPRVVATGGVQEGLSSGDYPVPVGGKDQFLGNQWNIPLAIADEGNYPSFRELGVPILGVKKEGEPAASQVDYLRPALIGGARRDDLLPRTLTVQSFRDTIAMPGGIPIIDDSNVALTQNVGNDGLKTPSGANSSAPVYTTGAFTTRSVAYTSVTSNGSVAAGARSVTITNVGSTNATVTGTVFEPLRSITFTADTYGLLPSIAYTSSVTSELRLVEVR